MDNIEKCLIREATNYIKREILVAYKQGFREGRALGGVIDWNREQLQELDGMANNYLKGIEDGS